MGGPGMGELKDEEKYAVMIEFFGPADPGKADEFNAELQKLLNKFKTQIRYQITGVKKPGDPA
jgi:hypothetical protein